MTTNAEAESTSATKREKERATEVQRTRRESRAEESGAWEEWLWWLWRAKVVRLGLRWRHTRCLEREKIDFVFGERENAVEGEGERD